MTAASKPAGAMAAFEIWMLPTSERLAAFIERWETLAEYAGCRTDDERKEMAAISDAIMPTLIRMMREKAMTANKKWKPLRRGTARDLARQALSPYGECGALSHGSLWQCSLKKGHRGNHQAWATEPLELCLLWRQVKR